eukprot:m.39199 g.39199  ORF g.39199 m.39199 type:complete len:55 (-) comp18120_c0_seq1:45-209(-)
MMAWRQIYNLIAGPDQRTSVAVCLGVFSSVGAGLLYIVVVYMLAWVCVRVRVCV